MSGRQLVYAERDWHSWSRRTETEPTKGPPHRPLRSRILCGRGQVEREGCQVQRVGAAVTVASTSVSMTGRGRGGMRLLRAREQTHLRSGELGRRHAFLARGALAGHDARVGLGRRRRSSRGRSGRGQRLELERWSVDGVAFASVLGGRAGTREGERVAPFAGQRRPGGLAGCCCHPDERSSRRPNQPITPSASPTSGPELEGNGSDIATSTARGRRRP